jgi:hypothetical protein
MFPEQAQEPLGHLVRSRTEAMLGLSGARVGVLRELLERRVDEVVG